MSIIKYSFASLSGAAEDIETSSRTIQGQLEDLKACLLYTSPSPRDS